MCFCSEYYTSEQHSSNNNSQEKGDICSGLSTVLIIFINSIAEKSFLRKNNNKELPEVLFLEGQVIDLVPHFIY